MTKEEFEKSIKEAYISGWVDREFKILRPAKQVKKIVRKYGTAFKRLH